MPEEPFKRGTATKKKMAEFREKHQNNDRAVVAAYGFSTKMSESECVAELFKRYQEMARRGSAES